VHHEPALERESGIDVRRLHRAAHEESGGCEHHERERELAHDQQVAHCEAGALGQLAGVFFELGHDVRALELFAGRTEALREAAAAELL
jgi:hypothetical protein